MRRRSLRNPGFEIAPYLPLLHLARLHRIPLQALDIDDRERAGIADAERLSISDPATPSDAYIDALAETYLAQQQSEGPSAPEAAPDGVGTQPGSKRFVEVRLIRDRAIAEGIVAVRTRPGSPLVVGIVGTGHLRDRHGVPAQLADLGIADAMVVLPQDGTANCHLLNYQTADFVFVLDPVEDES